MRVRSLRTYDAVPDLADHVIHFTGRTGRRINVDACIEKLPAQERLLHIVVDGRIRGFQTFGAGPPVVCLSESTKAAVAALKWNDALEASRSVLAEVGARFARPADRAPRAYAAGALQVDPAGDETALRRDAVAAVRQFLEALG